MKKTKIICTIGPATIEKKEIAEMYKSGMDAIRINLSHGDFDQYDKMIKNMKSVCDVPIIFDTQGPEVRTVNEHLHFEKGDVISFGLSVDVFKNLKKNDSLSFNDGLNKGAITDLKDKKVFLKMKSSGELMPNKSISCKRISFDLPILSKKDLQGIDYAVKNNASFIALSFTRNKNDVLTVKEKLKTSSIKIIAKIENQLGVNNFDEILSVADAVMVARGDLGTEIPSEKVPLIQKEIIKKCNLAGKPVIVATQMMESMINNPTPSRAETSDVANAIIDGADCLMLSGETSIGKYPIDVVKAVSSICSNVEKSYVSRINFENKSELIEDVIAYNVYLVSNKLDAKIICLTRGGYTARMINRFKPKNCIIAFSPKKEVTLQLMISYAIIPIYYPEIKEYGSEEVRNITKLCLKNKFIKEDDTIVFSAGLFVKKTTNTLIAYKAKDLLE